MSQVKNSTQQTKGRGKRRRGLSNTVLLPEIADVADASSANPNSHYHSTLDMATAKTKTGLSSSFHLCSDVKLPDRLIKQNAKDLTKWSDDNNFVVKVEEGRGGNFFGYYECGTPVKLNITLPLEIVKSGNDFYTTKINKTSLPANTAFRVRILQVTKYDTVFVKLDGNAKPGKGAYETMKAEMERFYGNSQKMKSAQFSMNGRIPVSGEVVVVRITRNVMVSSHNDGVLLRKMEYLRAKILEFNGEGATVKLLDEYGSGGVILDAILQIQPDWESLPAQVFPCKLHGMDLFNGRSFLYEISKACPLPQSFRNMRETSVRMRVSGHYTNEGLPLVQLELLNGLEMLSLKDFILERLHVAMNPFSNQVGSKGLPCRVVQYDKFGHIWVKLTRDEELGKKIHNRLQLAQRAFDDFRGTCSFSITDIVNKKYGNCNLKQLFVASLPDVNDDSKNVLQRVKIKRYFLNCNKIRVVSVDHGILHIIHTADIFPLSSFCSDLCHVPPLIHRAHLHRIKSMSTKDELVQTILFELEANICLMHENPVIGRPPEVQLFLHGNIEELKRQHVPDIFLLKDGVAQYLLTKQLAIGTPSEELLNSQTQALRIQRQSSTQNCRSEYGKPMISSFFSSFQFAWPN